MDGSTKIRGWGWWNPGARDSMWHPAHVELLFTVHVDVFASARERFVDRSSTSLER